jgi:hypothetical protein
MPSFGRPVEVLTRAPSLCASVRGTFRVVAVSVVRNRGRPVGPTGRGRASPWPPARSACRSVRRARRERRAVGFWVCWTLYMHDRHTRLRQLLHSCGISLLDSEAVAARAQEHVMAGARAVDFADHGIGLHSDGGPAVGAVRPQRGHGSVPSLMTCCPIEHGAAAEGNRRRAMGQGATGWRPEVTAAAALRITAATVSGCDT